MEVLKWDFDKQEYSIEDIPTDYDIRIGGDLEQEINCINCKKRIKRRDTYSSFRWHTQAGIGYCVCPECYHEELHEKFKEHIPRID